MTLEATLTESPQLPAFDARRTAELLATLRDMAKTDGHDFLAYLISLAEEEARAVEKRARPRA
jgi:hypothetical protein